ncbi:MAG TPA: translation initiation factor IF-3 [Candidatus Saccharimonadales bacterium]|nr:translation initiation factor IF-3 [Candidatus Saccharimonadales bacterium]
MKNKTETQLINEQIRAFKMRVISQTGENLGVLSRDAAIDLARKSNLDLVLLSDKDDVPLVKIMDFGKSLYAKKKKLSEGKKKQKVVKIKEIKMKPKIGIHDYQTKMNQGVGFLNDGHKLKITLVFRGREVEAKKVVGTEFFTRVDQTLADQGLTDLSYEKDAIAGPYWSRIYSLKTKK